MARSFQAFEDHSGEYVQRNAGASFDRTPAGDVMEVTQTRASQITAPIPGLGQGASARLPGIRQHSIVQMGRSLRPSELFVRDPRTVRSIAPTRDMIQMGGITREDAGQEAVESIDMTARERRQYGTNVIDMTPSHLKRRDVRNLPADVREMRRQGTALGQFTAPKATPSDLEAALRFVSQYTEEEQVSLIRSAEWIRNIFMKIHEYQRNAGIIIDVARKELPPQEAVKVVTEELSDTEVSAANLANSLRDALALKFEIDMPDPTGKEAPIIGSVGLWGMRSAAIQLLNTSGVDIHIEQIKGFDEVGIPQTTVFSLFGVKPIRRVISIVDGARTGLEEDLAVYESAENEVAAFIIALEKYERAPTTALEDTALGQILTMFTDPFGWSDLEKAVSEVVLRGSHRQLTGIGTGFSRAWRWVGRFLKSKAAKGAKKGISTFFKTTWGKLSLKTTDKKVGVAIKTSTRLVRAAVLTAAAVVVVPAVLKALKNAGKGLENIAKGARDLTAFLRDAAPWVGGAAVVGLIAWIGTSVLS